MVGDQSRRGAGNPLGRHPAPEPYSCSTRSEAVPPISPTEIDSIPGERPAEARAADLGTPGICPGRPAVLPDGAGIPLAPAVPATHGPNEHVPVRHSAYA